MSTADKLKWLLLVGVALLGVTWVVSLFLLSHARHHDYVSDCAPEERLARVELVGGYDDRPNERGSPYYLRLSLTGRDGRVPIQPRLTSSASGRILDLSEMERVQVQEAYEGGIRAVWVAPHLSIPYEDHVFTAMLSSTAEQPAVALACRLKRAPVEEWRIPLLDMLMSV